MKIPLNRVLALAGPYISLVAGGVAAWLVAQINVLGIPGLDQANLATWIAAGLTGVLGAGLTWLGHSAWLRGHHIQIVADAEVNAAAVANAPVAVPEAPKTRVTAAPPATWDDPPVNDPAVNAVADDELPTDEQEFASQPPADGSNVRPDVPGA